MKRPQKPAEPTAEAKPPRRVPHQSIQIRVARHILETLDRYAYKRGTTRTALIQDAIADWLEARRMKGDM